MGPSFLFLACPPKNHDTKKGEYRRVKTQSIATLQLEMPAWRPGAAARSPMPITVSRFRSF
jgi:hypothetical protein